MSHENVELVRGIYGPWGRGDFSSAEWAHPEIEYTIADLPAPVSMTGLAGMAEAYRSSAEHVGGVPSRTGGIPRARR